MAACSFPAWLSPVSLILGFIPLWRSFFLLPSCSFSLSPTVTLSILLLIVRIVYCSASQTHCSGVKEYTEAHHIVLERQVRKDVSVKCSNSSKIKPSLLSRPISLGNKSNICLAQTSPLHSGRKEGRKCQAGNKNGWELHRVSSSSKSLKLLCRYKGQHEVALSPTARLLLQRRLFYEVVVVHRNVCYRVYCARSEPRALNHLLCICAVFNSAHCEGEKAENTWDFHFATLLSGGPCQLGEVVFGRKW